MSSELTIITEDLLKACYTPAKSAKPRQGKNQIAVLTRMDGTALNKLYVSAPCHSTLLDGTGRLPVSFSVNAKEFYDLLKRTKSFSKECSLSISGDQLTVRFGTMKVSKQITIG